MFNISGIAKRRAIEKTLTPEEINKSIEKQDVKLIKLGFSVAERKKILAAIARQVEKYSDNL